MNSARLMPLRATFGLVFMTWWAGESRLSPRSRPRRMSPSVTVPSRRSLSSTTNAICSAERSITSIACRIERSLLRIAGAECFISVLSLWPRLEAGAGLHVAGDDRAGGDHRSGADPDVLDDNSASAEVAAVADGHRP